MNWPERIYLAALLIVLGLIAWSLIGLEKDWREFKRELKLLEETYRRYFG